MTARLLDGRGLALPALALATLLGYGAARSPLGALAAMGVVVLLVLVFLWAEAVLLLLVAALPWEDFLRYPTQTVSAVKLLGLLLAAAWFFRALTGRQAVRLPPTLLPVVLFGMAISTSFIFSPDPEAGTDKLLRYTLFIIFFFLVVQLATDRAAVRRFLRVLTLSATGAALWALVVFLQGNLERAGGPIGDPNDFAYLIAVMLPIAGYLFVEEPQRRPLWGVSFAILAGATLATLSRGALVGLAALVVWAIASRRVAVAGVVAGLATVAGVVLIGLAFWSPLISERVESKSKIANRNAESRLAFWDAATRMSLDHPLLGIGPARFGDESDTYLRNSPLDLQHPVVHNSYLEIMAENGIPALLAFLLYLGGSLTLLRRARRVSAADGDSEGVRLATALQAAFVVTVASGAFLSQQLALPFWFVGALAAAIGAEQARFAAPTLRRRGILSARGAA